MQGTSLCYVPWHHQYQRPQPPQRRSGPDSPHQPPTHSIEFVGRQLNHVHVHDRRRVDAATRHQHHGLPGRLLRPPPAVYSSPAAAGGGGAVTAAVLLWRVMVHPRPRLPHSTHAATCQHVLMRLWWWGSHVAGRVALARATRHIASVITACLLAWGCPTAQVAWMYAACTVECMCVCGGGGSPCSPYCMQGLTVGKWPLTPTSRRPGQRGCSSMAACGTWIQVADILGVGMDRRGGRQTKARAGPLS